jgi:hypothetical protein
METRIEQLEKIVHKLAPEHEECASRFPKFNPHAETVMAYSGCDAERCGRDIAACDDKAAIPGAHMESATHGTERHPKGDLDGESAGQERQSRAKASKPQDDR